MLISADSSPGFPEADPRATEWRIGCLGAHLAPSLPTGSLFPWSSQDRARSIRWMDQLCPLASCMRTIPLMAILNIPPGPGLSLTTSTHGQSGSPRQRGSSSCQNLYILHNHHQEAVSIIYSLPHPGREAKLWSACLLTCIWVALAHHFWTTEPDSPS